MISLRLRVLSVALTLGAAGCGEPEPETPPGDRVVESPWAIAAIADQRVVRNTVAPRSLTIDISVPDGPEVFDLSLLSSDPDVLPDQTLTCDANPCPVTLLPSPVKTATISVGVHVSGPDGSAETSFELDVGTLLVTDPTDEDPPIEGSLRQVLDAAEDGDVVGFDIVEGLAGVGQITLTRALPLAGSVQIEGPGADRLALDGAGATGLFVLDGTAVGRISGLTLSGSAVPASAGPGGAVTLQPGSRLFVEGCRFADNTAEHGAAIYSQGGHVEVRASDFRGNDAVVGGGAVFHDGPSLRILAGSSFTGNHASHGGAVHALDGEVEVADARFGGTSPEDANVALGDGGALYLGGEASLTLTGSTLLGNHADELGGALWIKGTQEHSITATHFEANSAPNDAAALILAQALTMRDTDFVGHVAEGVFVLQISAVLNIALEGVSIRDSHVRDGVLRVEDGFYALDDVELSGNLATDCDQFGGGLSTAAGKVDVTNSRWLDNVCERGFGGALRAGGVVVVTASEIRGNAAPGAGHGVFVGDGGDLTLLDTLVSGNGGTEGTGGGAYVQSFGRLVLDGGTEVSENQATYGAGVFVSFSGELVVEDAQIADNNASEDGGGIYTQNGEVYLASATRVAGNRAENRGGGIFQSISGAYLSLGDATIEGNSAGARGGGLYLAGGALYGTANLGITGNHAGEDGGGIYWTLTQFDCTFPVAQVGGNTAGRFFALDNISPDPGCVGQGAL